MPKVRRYLHRRPPLMVTMVRLATGRKPKLAYRHIIAAADVRHVGEFTLHATKGYRFKSAKGEAL